MKYSLSIKYEGNDIKIDRKPLSNREKKKIATIALCSFLAVAVAVAAPVTTISLMPKRVEGEVTKLSQIDFSKKTAYTLKKDITIPASYADKKMNCTIAGEGHKLIFEEGATLNELSGKISDAEIVTSGSPLFTSVSPKGEISNCTVFVNADIQTSESSSFVTVKNNGKIDGIILNISGSVSAVAGDSEVTFGGIALGNYATSQTVYGTITNCTVNYSNFTLSGETHANGEFGGIVGYNYGAVEECTVTGEISSDTFDLAGACVENGGLLSKVINEANLYQTSSDEGWNPVVGGIACVNEDTIWNCENKGSLTAKSTGVSEEGLLSVSVAGIVANNFTQYLTIFGYEYYGGLTEGCINSGAISAEGNETVIVGGIVSRTITPVSYCLSSGDISAVGKTVYAGGIFGRSEIVQDMYGYIYYGSAKYCISENTLTVSAGETACAGGIGGFVREVRLVDNYNAHLGYVGGGITKCFFLGSNTQEIDYFGNIVGACGENIYYETDLYYKDYHNFEDNFYADKSSFACGATVTWGDDNKESYEACLKDTGATVIEGNVEDLELYQEILEKLGK